MEKCPNTTDKKHLWDYKLALGRPSSLLQEHERIVDEFGNTVSPNAKRCYACGLFDPISRKK